MKSRINKKPHAGFDVGPIEKRIRTCRLFSFFYPGCKRPQINPASGEVRTGTSVCQTCHPEPPELLGRSRRAQDGRRTSHVLASFKYRLPERGPSTVLRDDGFASVAAAAQDDNVVTARTRASTCRSRPRPPGGCGRRRSP